MKVLIPMAGLGQRFVDAGYKDPKPFISVTDKPMLREVLMNIGIAGEYIFVMLKQHYTTHGWIFRDIVRQHSFIKKMDMVLLGKPSRGQLDSCLKARAFLNDNSPLLIANCDQLTYIDRFGLRSLPYALYGVNRSGYEAAIPVFKSVSENNSYAKVNTSGLITKTAEKQVISDNAICGIYMFKNASRFVEYGDKAIRLQERVNGEYYVSPMLNTVIEDGGKVLAIQAKNHYPLGTPEQLHEYKERFVINA